MKSRKILMCFSVLCRGHSHVFLEDSAKIRTVTEIKLECYLIYAERRGLKHKLCAVYFSREAVFCGRNPAVFLEKPFKVIHANVAHSSDLGYRMLLAQILFKVSYSFVNATEISFGNTVCAKNAGKFRDNGKRC